MNDLLPKDRPFTLVRDNEYDAFGQGLRRHREHGSHSLSYARVEISRTVLCLHKNCPDGWPKEWGTFRHDVTAGEAEVLVCNTCLYTTTSCTHLKCTWRGPVDGPELPGDIPSGPWLICDACGIDGT